MRVFPDTNILASAFATRGLCADLLRLVAAEHELITGEVIITELRRVLREKFGLSAVAAKEAEEFLRQYHVEERPRHWPELALRDRSDLPVIATALAARVDLFVTGDKELLALGKAQTALRIVSARELWNLLSRRSAIR